MKNEFKTKYGTVKIGTHGYYHVTSRKEGNARKLWHRLIWEDFYGCEIPKGYHVHHKNGNKLDNCILNLQLLNEKEHVRLHNKGENHPNYGKHLPEKTKRKISEALKGITLSDETKKNMSEAKKGEKNPRWKSHARIVKTGIKNGRQLYGIKKDGKMIKYSINPSKLLEWFTKEYPKEILQIKINISDDW